MPAMTALHLVIGNRNYSSWSMRPWLAMRMADVPFTEQIIWLDTPTARDQKLRFAPSGRVPILIEDGHPTWDSLAICERVAELFPDRGMWPADPRDRATARSLVAEMHSGFQALRTEMPLNCRRRKPLGRPGSAALTADIARITSIWNDARGPFLFGRFGIADAFFAPVAGRFLGYQVELTGAAAAYHSRMIALPAFVEWFEAGAAETQRIPATDAIP